MYMSVAKHGLFRKISNYTNNSQEHYFKINSSLNTYFSGLVEEANHHASRIVREVTGVGLQDTEVGFIYLPPFYTKRQLYYKWLHTCGYVVKSNARGCTPHLKDFTVR